MKSVEVVDLVKTFGHGPSRVNAVNSVSFKVKEGEFVTLLGSSGCGKSTTLRMIAGLIEADSGEIYIGGDRVTNVPPHKRGTGMVFQDYALFPHMNVFDNVAFPMKIRKKSREEIAKKVKELLDLVQLQGVENRYPSQLSGGQQQRVALARTLASDPFVLLLDEPLSNLDAKLRENTRLEIARLQRRIGITTIYVTHDQEEAFAISDKVLIMNKGMIEQEGTPFEIYEDPKTEFVASFIGRANFIDGKVQAVNSDGTVSVLAGDYYFVALSRGDVTEGDRVRLMVRPERVMVSKGKAEENVIEGEIDNNIFLGSVTRCLINTPLGTFTVDEEGQAFRNLNKGERVYLCWSKTCCTVLKCKGV
jgi:iron(III) transport system ATP-binding protein